MSTIDLKSKAVVNALQNATHIAAYANNASAKIKILKVISGADNVKVLVDQPAFESVDDDGVVTKHEKGVACVFASAASACAVFAEFVELFGDDQPQIIIKTRKTKKDKTVYFAEMV